MHERRGVCEGGTFVRPGSAYGRWRGGRRKGGSGWKERGDTLEERRSKGVRDETRRDETRRYDTRRDDTRCEGELCDCEVRSYRT
jgi:hypothetical protein